MIASSSENDSLFSIAGDVSVYNGEGSILLKWSIPDSIKLKRTIVYSQEFGDEKFEELASLAHNNSYFLDLNCKPGARYYYKVLIEDIYGKKFIINNNEFPFGSCDINRSSIIFDKNINSIFQLILKHIKEELYLLNPNVNFNYISQLLDSEKYYKFNWLENFPLDLLKSYSTTIDNINSIVHADNLYDEIMENENLYRNYFYMTPKMWEFELNKIISLMRNNWNILYDQYPKSVKIFKELDPIKIVGLKQAILEKPSVQLYIFHPDRLKISDWYLLSNNEYIDLEEFLINYNDLVSVDIPESWNNISLMMGDIVVQSLPIIKDESIIYTLEGDILPMIMDSSNYIKIKKDKSTLWINELIWDGRLKNFHIEIAGYQSIEEKYSLKSQYETIWNIEPKIIFEKQFLDSLFYFNENNEFPLVLKLQSINELETIIHEYVMLDSSSISISRLDDIGPWVESESNTLGAANKENQNTYDPQLVPQLFVLYQNYPNPFNGQTRITFDLLEDANISLYVIDATGRIHDKIIEEEFFNSGIYNYLWEGESRSSGVYFITLQAEVNELPPTVLSRKMIYLK